MKHGDCIFDPLKDINEVDQIGYVDLAEAYANHSVPSILSDDGEGYNNISDPAACMDMPQDVFDVLHQNQAVADSSADSVQSESQE